METFDVYKLAKEIVANWQHCGSNELGYSPMNESPDKWFPATHFAADCLMTFNNNPPGLIAEVMSAFTLKPVLAEFDVQSIEFAPQSWVQMKLQTRYSLASNPENSVSYPQIYTLLFNEEGKVKNYLVFNDPRDVAALVEMAKLDG